MRFDLTQGFPLQTTKRVFWRGTFEELNWFISGSTDVRELQAKGVRFWDSWQGEDGTIGPGYGAQMRNIEHMAQVKPRIYEPVASTIAEPTVFGVGTLGDYDKSDPNQSWLQSIWRDMIRRCYYVNSLAYPSYGGRGVHVDPSWFSFANFQRDVKRIPGWHLKLEYPEEYTLDKDVRHASNRYGPSTCMWASHEVQSANTSTNRFFKACDPDGNDHVFTSTGQAYRDHGLNVSAVHRCLNAKLRTHHGWSEFSYLNPEEGKVFRYQKIDQLKQVIAGLRHDPDSRRHIISLWNPHEVDRMELPPCHGNMIQFYVREGSDGSSEKVRYLDCQMYQRSGDALLGVPVNIASYSLLTHMIAQVVGMAPGHFVHSFGDVHIYDNHRDQVKEVLSREPRKLPELFLNKDVKDIDKFTFEDLRLEGYDPHPPISAPVAV